MWQIGGNDTCKMAILKIEVEETKSMLGQEDPVVMIVSIAFSLLIVSFVFVGDSMKCKSLVPLLCWLSKYYPSKVFIVVNNCFSKYK